MDFMKVFDQTVREIKREVNLKVLKIPEMEQKVLDATDNEPWGPHGSALAEIAQATKKFSECQMVMNVLWTRLGETGRDWRYVYKALSVIEYLVANGSERAVDDIIGHTYRISSLSTFEYLEPSGKDLGINVRKKVETIVAILNDKDKIQEVRNKATANRDKYIGLSSSGAKYKSGSASHFSSGFKNSTEGDTFTDRYIPKSRPGEEKVDRNTSTKSYQGSDNEIQGTSEKGKNPYSLSSSSEMALPKIADSDEISLNKYEDQCDDFDPRGTATADSLKQVDLFEQNLFGDFLDTPTPIPSKIATMNKNSAAVDLFADASFVSAESRQSESAEGSQVQFKVDLFASLPILHSSSSATVDFFSTTSPVVQAEIKSPNYDQISSNTADPFASVPQNSFDGTCLFASHVNLVSSEATQKSSNDGNTMNNSNVNSSLASKSLNKKDTFQVKSGIWADTLNRGLIDLNISAPVKLSLTDIGVVGALSDGTKEGVPNSTFMGRAMGLGNGVGKSENTPLRTDDDFFSNFHQSAKLL